MFYQEFDFNQASAISRSDQTVRVSEVALDEENTMIAIDSAAMFAGELRLRAAPHGTNIPARGQIRERVLHSLDKSLSDHADVWTELSKY